MRSLTNTPTQRKIKKKIKLFKFSKNLPKNLVGFFWTNRARKSLNDAALVFGTAVLVGIVPHGAYCVIW